MKNSILQNATFCNPISQIETRIESIKWILLPTKWTIDRTFTSQLSSLLRQEKRVLFENKNCPSLARLRISFPLALIFTCGNLQNTERERERETDRDWWPRAKSCFVGAGKAVAVPEYREHAPVWYRDAFIYGSTCIQAAPNIIRIFCIY